jgi:aryl-alcohol dehydrogenase-like predicted oxidoreductase
LQTDYLDLYYQHRIDLDVPAEEVAGVMRELIKGDTFSEADYRSVMPQYADEAYDSNQKLMELIRNYADEKNATPAQISLAWMMSKKPYIVPIPGSRKPERIRENAGAAEVVLSEQEVRSTDEQLDVMNMSGVFGGSPVKR